MEGLGTPYLNRDFWSLWVLRTLLERDVVPRPHFLEHKLHSDLTKIRRAPGLRAPLRAPLRDL